MVNIRKIIQPTKTWEILATFFGYFAISNDVPQIFRTLGLSKIVPYCIKEQLLFWNQNVDFWILWFFTGVTVFGTLWLLWPEKIQPEDKNEDRVARIVKTLKRHRIIRIIRSLGLVLVRESLLGIMGVSTYGTFRRPDEWSVEESRFDFIDRISFINTNGYEFQYSKSADKIIIREHPKNNDQYGPESETPLTWHHAKVLLIASNFFPFWLLIYFFKKCFMWLKKLES